MKKLAIAIALVLLVGAFAMAGDVVISGSATTTFGYNLDTQAYGLLSEVSSDITLTVGEADGSKQGEGAWYGVIELTGANISTGSTVLEVYANDGDDDVDDVVVSTSGTGDANYVTMPFAITVPTVSAKITDGNLYAQLQSEASFAADYVAAVEEDDVMSFSSPDTVGSWVLGGVFGPATVAVEFGTEDNYEGAGPGYYAYGTTVALDVAPLAVNLAFAGSSASGADMGIAAQVVADVAPLTVTAAFDGISGASFVYEAGLGVAAALDPATVGVDVYYAEDNVDLSTSVGFAADAVNVKNTFYAYNLTQTMSWKEALDLTYSVDAATTVNAGFSYDSDSVVAAYANVAMTGLVDGVTFTLGWADGDDLTNDVLGVVTFATEIAY